MKSGLEGRNNKLLNLIFYNDEYVSMKSGLEGRNNANITEFRSTHVI